jgi:fermentation-respiration switch protein FrsA (DUF1100 family)
LLGSGVLYLVGSLASAPARAMVGAPPSDLPIQPVTIESSSGSRLAGWLIAGRPRAGAVMLMHGLRANRLEMLGRARFLHRHGFTVLLFDFQAHGESTGRMITFGYLESADARAAFDFLKRKLPAERIGVIGVSMGGAAAVLGELPADAMVLEQVYANFSKAVENHLIWWLGAPGRYLEPALSWQVRPRLGFDHMVLQPAERIAKLRAPVLLIAGDEDEHATLQEMRLLFARARGPKQLWVIPDAWHLDFHSYAPAEYERRVLQFLRFRLRR